jgi:hypothetical protein
MHAKYIQDNRRRNTHNCEFSTSSIYMVIQQLKGQL